MSAQAGIGSLARFVRRAPREERCDLCGSAIAERHAHLVDRADRRLLCACTACGFAFVGSSGESAKGGRYRVVPDRVRAVEPGAVGVEQLHALGVPIGLAFFFRPSSLGRWMGVFPGPAGPTEAELADGAWDALAARSEVLRGIDDDVEALLVRTGRDRRTTALAVPIDVCYELTALLRRAWRGFDGGDEGRNAVDAFFAALDTRAREGGA